MGNTELVRTPLYVGLGVVAVAVLFALLVGDSDPTTATTTRAPATTGAPTTAAPATEVEFDVRNATFDVSCVYGPESGPVPFIDGGWGGEIYDDDPLDDYPGLPGNRVWVREVAIGELVEESPGPEVLAEIGCSGGGSHTAYEVQVFAGNTGEARRLGRILYEVVDDHAYTVSHFRFGSENTITTRKRVWQGYDAQCCPSKYVLTDYKWIDGDWVETDSEAWVMESWMIEAWERESKKAES